MSNNEKAAQEEVSQATSDVAKSNKEAQSTEKQASPVKGQQAKAFEPDTGAGEESRDSVVSAEGDESVEGDEEEAGDEEETDEEGAVASAEAAEKNGHAEKNGQKVNGVTEAGKNLKRSIEETTEDASVQKKKKVEGSQETEQEHVKTGAD